MATKEVSRQRMWQIKQVELNRCMQCGKLKGRGQYGSLKDLCIRCSDKKRKYRGIVNFWVPGSPGAIPHWYQDRYL